MTSKLRAGLALCPVLAACSLSSGAASRVAATPQLTASQVVAKMVQQNQLRAGQLQSYTDLRHYKVSYRGFPLDLSASMVVEATYQAPDIKRFHILSTKGSGLLIDHVLRKLLAAEQEAALHPSEAAISPSNYSFTLLGTGKLNGRRCYILRADPKTSSQLLFRGRIWVDAAAFAVVQVEAEPAHSPSFWIKDTHIHHVYARTGRFWLPHSDRSTTGVRFGGAAVLTINYGVYDPVSRDAKT